MLRFRVSYPKWCCPYCGEPVGYVGNWLAWLLGTRFHGCTMSNVKGPREP